MIMVDCKNMNQKGVGFAIAFTDRRRLEQRLTFILKLRERETIVSDVWRRYSHWYIPDP